MLEKYGIQEADDIASKKAKLQQITYDPRTDKELDQWKEENLSGKWSEKALKAFEVAKKLDKPISDNPAL